MGFNIITITTLSAMAQLKEAFALSILRGVAVILPVLFLLSYFFGLDGVWLTIPVTELLIALLGVILLLRARWKLKKRMKTIKRLHKSSRKDDKMLTISYATQADLPSWMKLVRLLRWNFPGLETEEALSEYEKRCARILVAAAQSVQRITSKLLEYCFFAPSQRAFLHSDPPRLQAAGNCLKADWQNASKARRHKGYHCFHLSERGSKGQCPARALSKIGV